MLVPSLFSKTSRFRKVVKFALLLPLKIATAIATVAVTAASIQALALFVGIFILPMIALMVLYHPEHTRQTCSP